MKTILDIGKIRKSIDLLIQFKIPEVFFLELFFKARLFGNNADLHLFIHTASDTDDLIYSLYEIEHEWSWRLESTLNGLSELIEQYNATDLFIDDLTDDDLILEMF